MCRTLLFTELDFFTGNGISILLSAAKVANSVCEDSLQDLWQCVLSEEHDAVVRGLKRQYDVVVVRRKENWDTSVRWFGLNSCESYVVGESWSQHGVRISNVVEVGEVKYMNESVRTP